MGVDLLLIDTGEHVEHSVRLYLSLHVSNEYILAGDLHDGTGLSDASAVDGQVSSPIFEQLDSYDLLTIGRQYIESGNPMQWKCHEN